MTERLTLSTSVDTVEDGLKAASVQHTQYPFV